MYLSNLPTLLRLALSPASHRALAEWRRQGRRPVRQLQALRAVRALLDGERVVRHEGRFVFSSFLPPFPSPAFLAGIAGGDAPDLAARLRGARRAPISVYCALTARCPMACGHCSAAGQGGGDGLGTGEWKRVFAGLQDLGVAIIGLTGGEPLLRPDLEELVAAIDRRSVAILFTSGRGLTAERARALKRAGLFGLAVSLDGADSDAHDRSRGRPGAFADATAAIAASRAAGLYSLAQMLVTRARCRAEAVLPVARLAARCGAHELRLIEPIPCGRLQAGAEDDFLDEPARRRLLAIHRAINRRPWLPKATTFAHTEHAERFGCGAGSQHAYIDAAGRLRPCDFVAMDFGPVRDGAVAERWRDMHARLGPPRRRCLAHELHGALRDRALPLDPAASAALCSTLPDGGTPGVYRRLLAAER